MAKARILFKTDKTANWDKTFKPLAGELCVFSDYEDTGKTNHLGNKIYRPNAKIGTGNKSLPELSFLGNNAIEDFEIKLLFGINENTTSSKLGEGRLGYMVLA
jgi:hypothetical protein